MFEGQNASTGEPHPKTGRMSTFGVFHSFAVRHHAERYIEENEVLGMNQILTLCTVLSGRKYRLGRSVAHYLEELSAADYRSTL